MSVHSCHLLFHHFQFTMIHGPNIPGSYAILFFIALDFTSITNHICKTTEVVCHTLLQWTTFCQVHESGKLEVVKQEMARVTVDILGINELKLTGMGELNTSNHYIYYCGQESLRRNGVALIVNIRV